jgi:hypothetical protein
MFRNCTCNIAESCCQLPPKSTYSKLLVIWANYGEKMHNYSEICFLVLLQNSTNYYKHCLAATLLSVEISLFQVSSNFWKKKNACEISCWKSPYLSTPLYGCNKGQQCSLLWYPWTIVVYCNFLTIPVTTSSVCDFRMHSHNTRL